MASDRRMGPRGSEIWLAMLGAAEDILREEGYGALTSRRVSERIGVKQRLIYYYFRTMDELIVETFRALAVREVERLNRALLSRHPLRETWQILVETSDTKLVSEFMALANRIDALRQEVAGFIEHSRALQVEALSRAMADSAAPGTLSPVAPVAIAIFATSAALSLHREAALGIATGHAEVLRVIEDTIARLDPPDQGRS
ncbi:TetR/AcrR family transcriptional regulator [Novosphingobium album (ex Liu et al. 2023)]|uniref:Helix-turn-helix domain containing protein n=1 Tax=Novosphingobium album (ex Liu et al. 2023) TaxID=3031130 RepID=A0ABT5WPC1_9SPHN|nr:TetR/AcrR family transcriptional regulator [Novosphingobium album (ex Liu et al. 2023)]MDE8651596.1 helix-turn-helix domain containing protein [Novosphingobium album (ex Liu et al. 2023)]